MASLINQLSALVKSQAQSRFHNYLVSAAPMCSDSSAARELLGQDSGRTDQVLDHRQQLLEIEGLEEVAISAPQGMLVLRLCQQQL
jgi:hypothetical protein